MAAPVPAPITRLCLITPPITDAEAFAPALAAAVGAAEIACVILVLAESDERALINRLKRLAPIAQDKGAAVLVADRPGIVARGGADGAFVSRPGTGLDEAIETLKPDRIVGVGGVTTRHDAMETAERDIDFLSFGEPRRDESLPDPEAAAVMATWWAEIFQVPCVAVATDAAAVEPMAATGAEFLGLGPWIFAGDPAQAVATAASAARKADAART